VNSQFNTGSQIPEFFVRRGRAALSRAIQILKRDDGHLNAGNFGCVILTGGKRDCHGC